MTVAKRAEAYLVVASFDEMDITRHPPRIGIRLLDAHIPRTKDLLYLSRDLDGERGEG